MKKELGLITVGALVAMVLTGASGLWAGDIHTDGNVESDGQLVSTATSGPPLAVSSTEMVDNLNADQLDGLEGSDLYTQAEVDAITADLQAQIDALAAAPGSGMIAKDSAGNTVGPIVAFSTNNGEPLVEYRYDSLLVLLVVRENFLALPEKLFFEGTEKAVFRRVWYDQTGCFGSAYTGQGWTDVENLVGVPESFHAVGYGNILYQWTGGFPSVTVQSYSDNPSHCENLTEPNQGIGDGYTLVEVLDLDDVFTPPFHIE